MAEPRGETVALIHGLGRSPVAMLPLAWTLRRAGYRTVNLGYVAARRPLAATAARIGERLDRARAEHPGEPFHLVTHSLGGILARTWLGRVAPAGSRLVQLAPPNQGARLAERLKGLGVARALLGQALVDLGHDEHGKARYPLPPVANEVGVVAGGTGADKGYGAWLEGDNDGVVRVAETWLPEARDWILLPRLHTFIMNARDTHANVLAFLGTGRFLEGAPRLERAADGSARSRAQ